MSWWLEHEQGAEAVWLAFLGKCFAECRANLRMSVRELSKITAVSPSHILRIESGEYDFTVTKFLRLCEAFALPPGCVLEPALFKSRRPNQILSNLREEKEFLSLLAGNAKREDALIHLILGLFRAILAVLASSNPLAIAQAVELPFPAARERLRKFAEGYDWEGTHVERLFTIQSICSRPFGKMTALGLLDREFVTAYLAAPASRDFDAFSMKLKGNPALTRDDGGWVLLGAFDPGGILDPAKKEKLGKGLLSVTPKSKRSDVKSEIEVLRRRLAKATGEPGAKSELAKHLGVALPRISEWLSGVKEPGGETTLRLLRWLEARGEK